MIDIISSYKFLTCIVWIVIVLIKTGMISISYETTRKECRIISTETLTVQINQMYHIIMISLAVVYLGDMIKSALIMTISRTRMINGVRTGAWAFNKITPTTYERPILI